MKSTKKFLALLLAFLFAFSVVACDDKKKDDDDDGDDEKTVETKLAIEEELFELHIPEDWDYEDGDSYAYSEDGKIRVAVEDPRGGSDSKELAESLLEELRDEHGDELVIKKDVTKTKLGGEEAYYTVVDIPKGDLFRSYYIVCHMTDAGDEIAVVFSSAETYEADDAIDFDDYKDEIKAILKEFVIKGDAADDNDNDKDKDNDKDDNKENDGLRETVDVASSQAPSTYSKTKIVKEDLFTIKIPSEYASSGDEYISPNGKEIIMIDEEDADGMTNGEAFEYFCQNAEKTYDDVSTRSVTIDGKSTKAFYYAATSGGQNGNVGVAIYVIGDEVIMIGYASTTLSMSEVRSELDYILGGVSLTAKAPSGDDDDREDDTEDGFKVADTKTGIYTLYVPKDWTKNGNLWIKPDNSANVSVNYARNSTNATLAEYVAASIDELEKTVDYPDFKIEEDQESAVIDSAKATAIAYTMTVNGVKVYGVQIYAVKGNYVYCITYSMNDPSTENGRILEEILDEIELG